VSEVGAPGVVVIMAPLPAAEAVELPYVLIAVTVACTFVPHSRLYGAALRANTGTVQVVAVDEDMSQLAEWTVKVVASLCLILIV